jgi:putative ABC transport system permease protein
LRAVRAEVVGSGLETYSQAEVRARALEIFDRSFAVTVSLRILAVLVAALGILGALLALQMERRRTTATLHALGMTIPDIARASFLETGVIGALAGLWAMPTGTLLAWILTFVINLRSFGWTMDWGLPPAVFATAFATGVVSALAAAVYPVLRLARSPVVDGLRTE